MPFTEFVQDLRTTRKETKVKSRSLARKGGISLVPFPKDFADRPLFLCVSPVVEKFVNIISISVG
jgi:hypothetical protein